jgi:hypothetical protein
LKWRPIGYGQTGERKSGVPAKPADLASVLGGGLGIVLVLLVIGGKVSIGMVFLLVVGLGVLWALRKFLFKAIGAGIVLVGLYQLLRHLK